MFNYLNISTQPSFSHNFLETLSRILFMQNDFLRTFSNLLKNPQIESAFNFDNFVASPEKIPQFVNNYSWFGLMVSYNYLSNNFEIIIILLMTLVRLIILYLILGCCKKFGIFYRRKKISYLKYFITDVITMTPSMTISATLTLLKSGNLNFYESLNTFLHIITYFIILILPIAFLSISISQKSRLQGPKKKKAKLNLSFH